MSRAYFYSLLNSLGQQPGFKHVKFRIKSKIFLLDSITISLCYVYLTGQSWSFVFKTNIYKKLNHIE